MTRPVQPPVPPPSTRRLVVTSAWAFVVAAVVLVVAVLPAEYGFDPLGTGSALGLMRAEVSDPPPAVEAGDGLAPVNHGPFSAYGAPHRTDAVEFELGPYEYLEYKYRMVPGATMVYSWEASAPVLHDFHGAPSDGGAEVSLDKAPHARAHGSLRAAFDGMHGWFWENPGWTSVRIRLTSAGFYAGAVESRSDRTQRVHTPVPALEAPGNTGR